MGRPHTANRRIFNDMVGLNRLAHDGKTLVVVALPSENDPVQKVSSEKAAHMTLLYLGKPDFDQSRIDLISGFIEHAASTLSPFMLEVERRGELGPDKADVLFFIKRYVKRVETFRNQLLQNDLISEAYHSIEQYPEWTPHLTLGYPASPAMKSPSEDAGIWYVNFDRISLWTGDSTGPTFQLAPKDSEMEVAMSQTQRGRSFLMGDTLTHYGVKGMHWGTRKGDSGGSSSAPAAKPAPKPRMSEDAKNVEKAFTKISRGGTDALSNHELQSVVSRLNLEQQYSRMMASPSTSQQNQLDQGHAVVKQMLGIGKTVNDVHKFMKSPAGKAIVTGFKAAKFGVKAYANPVGTAVSLVTPKNHFTNVG